MCYIVFNNSDPIDDAKFSSVLVDAAEGIAETAKSVGDQGEEREPGRFTAGAFILSTGFWGTL